MVEYGSLFGRLSGDADKHVDWSREVSVMASVATHLGKMLSTRTDSVQTPSGYRLPDPSDMCLGLHDSLSQACSAIEGFIETYEPRLSSIRIVSLPYDNDQLRLVFGIEGLLEVEGFKRQVSFFACLDGDGQVKVN